MLHNWILCLRDSLLSFVVKPLDLGDKFLYDEPVSLVSLVYFALIHQNLLEEFIILFNVYFFLHTSQLGQPLFLFFLNYTLVLAKRDFLTRLSIDHKHWLFLIGYWQLLPFVFFCNDAFLFAHVALVEQNFVLSSGLIGGQLFSFQHILLFRKNEVIPFVSIG